MFVVYRIECETPNHWYVGQSQNVNHRLERHKCKDGAEFTKRHGVKSWRLIAVAPTRPRAVQLETKEFRRLKALGLIVGGCYSMDLQPSRSATRAVERPLVSAKPALGGGCYIESNSYMDKLLADSSYPTLRSKSRELAKLWNIHPENAMTRLRRYLKRIR